MADDRSVVRFAVNRWNRFYMCRSCRNHLVSSRNSEVISHRIHCEKVLNVKVDNDEDTWDIRRVSVANVACKLCDSGLGSRMITYSVQRRVGRFTVYNRNERFQLKRDAVLYWNGSEVLYADTWEPVEDNANA